MMKCFSVSRTSATLVHFFPPNTKMSREILGKIRPSPTTRLFFIFLFFFLNSFWLGIKFPVCVCVSIQSFNLHLLHSLFLFSFSRGDWTDLTSLGFALFLFLSCNPIVRTDYLSAIDWPDIIRREASENTNLTFSSHLEAARPMRWRWSQRKRKERKKEKPKHVGCWRLLPFPSPLRSWQRGWTTSERREGEKNKTKLTELDGQARPRDGRRE